MTLNLENQLQELKNNKSSIDDFFTSTPYDQDLNSDGFLTKELFGKKLRSDEGFHKPMKILTNAIFSYQKGKKIILLNGFSGTGKTTFIHYYSERNEDFHHIFIDFEEIDENLRFKDGVNTEDIYKSSGEHLLKLFKGYLLQNGFLNPEIFEKTYETFFFILNNKERFSKFGLISRQFYLDLSSLEPDSISNQTVIEFINKFNYNDIFIFFFTLCFKFYSVKEKVIIYFDNLDKVDLEYLTDTFLENFQSAISKANILSQSSLFKEDKIKFNQRFRFIFCLRDANGILFNQHIADRVKMKIKVIPVFLGFNQKHFEKIISKRLEVLKEIYDLKDLGDHENYSGKHFLGNLNTLISDDYFKKVFIPLFNNDYRNSVLALLDAVRNISSNDNFFYKDERLEFGARGYLLFELIQKFFKENFISDYPFLTGKIDGLPNGHYCFIDRMIITVLCHNTRYTVKNIGQETGRSCKFYSQLIKELEVLYNYDYELILDSISRLFTYHESENWVHLISILNKKIRSADDFREEKELLNELKSLKEISENRNEHRIKQIIDSLDRIRIKLNPSAYIYVKYILPHFEFYSNLSNNEQALYQNFYVKENLHSYKYELILKSVFEHISRHKNRMELFYEYQMQNVISKSNFYNSQYCFKLIGEGDTPLKGYFHLTRIITSHIDYLDRFRRKMLVFNQDKPLFDKLKFNEILVKQIEKYILLLENSIDIRAKKHLVPSLREKANDIISSKYRDFKIQIRLPKEHNLRK